MSEGFKTIDHHDDNECGETALCVDCISYLAEDGEVE
jgi:hypothetical protein